LAVALIIMKTRKIGFFYEYILLLHFSDTLLIIA
jgi:hypothetical protein